MLRKKLLKKTFLAFKNGVKSIQTAGYNDARTVVRYLILNEMINMHGKFIDLIFFIFRQKQSIAQYSTAILKVS